MKQEPKKLSRPGVNLAIDITIFAAFLVSTAPRFTGMAIHEWLGMAFGAAIVAHLLLHWQWIVGTTQRLLRNASRRARINYLLNALLFMAFTLIIFSGLMISEVALPLFGLHMPDDRIWSWLHRTAADLSVFLIGLHVALHWQWIVSVFTRYVAAPLSARQRVLRLDLATQRTQKES